MSNKIKIEEELVLSLDAETLGAYLKLMFFEEKVIDNVYPSMDLLSMIFHTSYFHTDRIIKRMIAIGLISNEFKYSKSDEIFLNE